MAAIFIPSVLWMWPRPGNTQWYWNSTEPIVYTPSKNYTAKDLPDLLTDMVRLELIRFVSAWAFLAMACVGGGLFTRGFMNLQNP